MKTATFRLPLGDEQIPALPLPHTEVDLLLVFGERSQLENPYLPGKLRLWFPKAELAGAEAPAPEGGGLTALAMNLDKAQVESVYRFLSPGENPRKVGWDMGRQIDADDLKVVLLLGAGPAETRRAVAEGMLDAFGPCPPLVCPGLSSEAADQGGEIILSSAGLFRNGFVAVGIFGGRIEVEQEARPVRGSGNRPFSASSPGRGGKQRSLPEEVLSLFRAAA